MSRQSPVHGAGEGGGVGGPGVVVTVVGARVGPGGAVGAAGVVEPPPQPLKMLAKSAEVTPNSKTFMLLL